MVLAHGRVTTAWPEAMLLEQWGRMPLGRPQSIQAGRSAIAPRCALALRRTLVLHRSSITTRHMTTQLWLRCHRRLVLGEDRQRQGIQVWLGVLGVVVPHLSPLITRLKANARGAKHDESGRCCEVQSAHGRRGRSDNKPAAQSTSYSTS